MQFKSIFSFLVLILGLVLFVQYASCSATKASGSCPIKATVKICLPKCLGDYDCVGNKRCCPNSCGTMSCAEVSPVNTGNDPNNRPPSVVTCSNEKCLPGQKCKASNSMKRPKCSW